MNKTSTTPRALALAAAALLLAGCASLSADRGVGPVQQAAQQRLGMELKAARSEADVQTIARRVDELLAQPLTPDSAVQIALLNHRGLQASLQELGIAEAEWVQASRLPNPGFSYARLSRGEEREIERSFSFDIGHLLMLPFVAQAESRRYEATQRSVTMQMFAIASQARKAYYAAVAADQSLGYTQQVKRTAEQGAELARRMAQAGSFNKLQQAREQAFYADATLNLARAQQAQVAA